MNLMNLHPKPGSQAFFRFRPIKSSGGDKVLITNQEGNYLLLTEDEFRDFAEDTVEPESELYQRLSDQNFLKATYDVQKAVERVKTRKYFVHGGPLLHIMVVTLRCNETCVYCHASRANMDAVDTDMSLETAEKAVDLALQTTNPSVTIEFQGGEPLVNFPVVKHIIEHARKRNEELGKRLEFTMVSNFALLDDEKLDYLVENKVQLCTSIDGPEKLHNAQRKLATMNAHQLAVQWMKRVNQRYGEMGLDTNLYHVEALLTITKDTLGLWKETIDTYVDLGCKTIFLRPVDPFGFADRVRLKIEYPRSAYLEFYRRAVDYMIELNKQGVQILERYGAIFLTKILRGEDPNFLDLRSPAGAGIAALAYNYDGRVFTCDEGRMLWEMGDDVSEIGHVGSSAYRDITGHETVRAMTIATNLDAQPDCVNCAYNPYCGTNAAYNHKSQGSIFGRMRDNNVCAVHKGIQDYLFEKLADADEETLKIFDRWTTIRPREHFIQEGG